MTLARLLLATVVGLTLLFLALPIVVVMVVSFSSATYLTFPPPSLGLRWYTAYFSSDDWLRPTWLSLWVAACVVVLATLLGTLAAVGIGRLPRALRMLAAWRYQFRRYERPWELNMSRRFIKLWDPRVSSL